MPRQLPDLPTGDWTLVGCDFNRIEVSLFRLPYNGESEKSKQMTLSACPICYGMRNVKAE